MYKKNTKVHGFTLIELIVVIAIIGVLAAILVPSILGYVKKAKFAAANANAKVLLNAGMLACREADVIKPIPEGIYTQVNVSAYGSGYYENETMNRYIHEHFPLSDSSIWAIKVEEDVVTGAFIASDEMTNCIGTYPHPNSEHYSLTDKTFEELLEFAATGSWT